MRNFTLVLFLFCWVGTFAQQPVVIRGDRSTFQKPYYYDGPKELAPDLDPIPAFFSLPEVAKSEAKDLHGFVVDEAGLPLPGANIIVKNEDSFLEGTTSDTEGYFQIKTKATEIEVSFLGYQAQIISANELENNPWVEMKESVFDLETVVVSVNGSVSTYSHTCICQLISKEIIPPENKKTISSPTLEMRTYPNPTIDWINIDTPDQKGKLLLYSADGKLLRSMEVTERTSQFDLSHFSAGTYLVRYELKGTGSIVRQVVKIKR